MVLQDPQPKNAGEPDPQLSSRGPFRGSNLHILHPLGNPESAAMTTRHLRPNLGFWEKADLSVTRLFVFPSLLYHAIAGVFRGKASPRRYDHFIMTNVIRKLVTRTTDRQKQYV